MGLINKLFGRDKSARNSVPASGFEDSDSTTDSEGPKSAPRRELVQVVLRDTMRKHGIPSDWIDCRILSVVSKRSTPGMHVQLLVRKGDETLLTYVHAFQASFLTEIERFDSNASDWMLSLCWQFEGNGVTQKDMPNPALWTSSRPSAPGALGGVAAPADATGILGEDSQSDDDELSQDLAALFAIRDAALTGTAPLEDEGHADFEATRPGEDPPPSVRKKR